MSAAVRSLYQDFLGQERYIEHIRIMWISAWITVPLAVAGIVFALVMMRVPDDFPARVNRKENQWTP